MFNPGNPNFIYTIIIVSALLGSLPALLTVYILSLVW